MKNILVAAFAAALLAPLSVSSSLAGPKDEKVATAAPAPAPARTCVPADGAQILAGFAAPNEWIDRQSGEICDPR